MQGPRQASTQEGGLAQPTGASAGKGGYPCRRLPGTGCQSLAPGDRSICMGQEVLTMGGCLHTEGLIQYVNIFRIIGTRVFATSESQTWEWEGR